MGRKCQITRIVTAILVAILSVQTVACTKKENITKESIAVSEKQEEEESIYQFSSYEIGVETSRIIRICKKDEKIFILGEMGEDTLLIQCTQDGSKEKQVTLKMKKGEVASNITVDEENRLRILTSVIKKKRKYYIKTVKENGKIIDSYELKQKKSKEGVCFPDISVIASDGSVYMANGNRNEQVILFDAKGKEINRVDCQKMISSIIQTEDKSIYAYGIGAELIKLDMEKGMISESLSLGDFDMSGGIIHSGMDGMIYVSDTNNVYSFDIISNKLNRLFEWTSGGINGNNIRDYLPMENGSFFAVNFSFGEEAKEAEIILVEKKKTSETAEKKILTLACVNLNSGNMIDNILEFNQTNENYQIQVKDYSSESLDAYIQLNLDILSGEIPDIICLNMLPADMYVEKGLLTDLYPLMEQDEEIHADNFVDSIRRAAEKDGKLYYMGACFGLDRCIIMERKYLESDGGWSVKDMEKLYQKMPEDKIFIDNMTKQKFITNMVLSQIDDYIDKKKKKVNFDSDEFISLLSFSDHFPDKNKIDNSIIENPYEEIVEGKLIAYNVGYCNLCEIAIFNSLYQNTDGYQVMSYPSRDRSNRLFASFIDPAMAISEQCEDKEGAWEFLRQFFTYDYEMKTSKEHSWNFPTRKDVLEKVLEYATVTEKYVEEDGTVINPLEGGSGYMDYNIEYHPLSEEDISFIRSLIDRVEKINMDADDMQLKILDIVIIEAESYFAGDKTAEETAEIIQNRVQLYVNENS